MTRKKKTLDLDDEEKAILESIENGEWQSVGNLEEEKMIAMQAAKNFLQKDARINIRMSSSDLNRLKRIAAYEGLPYQTLISSILHKYASGHL